MDGEVGIEPDLVSVAAQQPRADAMKSAGPGQRIGHNVDRLPFTRLVIRSTRRVISAAARREMPSANPPRIGTVDDQVRHAMRQGVRLA